MIVCNELRPSENSYARVLFKRVAASDDLLNKLANSKDELSRSQVYAQAGIWLDSIANSYEAYSQKPYNSMASQYFFQLLEQIGLIKVNKAPM